MCCNIICIICCSFSVVTFFGVITFFESVLSIRRENLSAYHLSVTTSACFLSLTYVSVLATPITNNTVCIHNVKSKSCVCNLTTYFPPFLYTIISFPLVRYIIVDIFSSIWLAKCQFDIWPTSACLLIDIQRHNAHYSVFLLSLLSSKFFSSLFSPHFSLLLRAASFSPLTLPYSYTPWYLVQVLRLSMSSMDLSMTLKIVLVYDS